MSRGPFVTLWSGRRWYFTQPTPEDVHAADWVGLAYVNRYGGAAGPYSVLEHQIRGVWLAELLDLPKLIRRAFAVHDNPEAAPPSDVLGPVVVHLKKLQAETGVADPVLAIRAAAETATYTRCGVLDVFRDPEQSALVHKLDVAMCAAEKRDLLRGWANIVLPEWAPRERIVPMPTHQVLEEYQRVLDRYAPELDAEFREGAAL